MISEETYKAFSGSCKLPRKQSAIEALLSLSWKKEKKARPIWLIKELESI